MRVSTRLIMTGLFVVGVVVALAAVLVSTTRAVKRELSKNEVAGEVLSAITGIRYLTLEYLLRGDERPKVQWRLRHASLSKLLSSPNELSHEEDADILSALRQSNQTVADLFSELTRRHQTKTDSDIAADLDARLTAQIIVRLERMISDARKLSERSREGVLYAQQRASQAVVIVGGIILLVVIASTYLTHESVSRPLARLRESTAIVGAGNLDFHVDIASRDEIGELARAFNDMTAQLRKDLAERKRAQQALAQIQADLARVTRVATLGEMTASIAHEINQPLGAIVNNASAGLRWLAADNLDEARRSAALVIADSHRASEIVARIRAMVKKTPPRKEWIDINDALEAAIALAHGEASKHRIELISRLSRDVPPICVDKIQIQQVVFNLVINAIEAMRLPDLTLEEPRALVVSSASHEAGAVQISVRDSGAGLPSDQVHHMFDAFYTTKPEGLGMGLAVSRSIVEAHHGRLWATANEDRGATFQFTLPVAGSEVS